MAETKTPTAPPSGSQTNGLKPSVPNAPITPKKRLTQATVFTSLFPWMTALAILSLLANALLYFRFTTLRPLVTVGSKVITKRQYLAVMDETAGKAVLNKMVYDELVTQAAAKAGVTPSSDAIDAYIEQVGRANPQAVTAPIWTLRQNAATALALET